MTLRISAARDERGVALPLALFALVLLSGLLLAFLGMSLHEPQIAQNHVSSSRALHIADAGIEHAWAVLPSTPGITALSTGQTLNPFSAQVFGGGSYTVTVIKNADETHTITSTALYKDASRVIRAVVSLGPTLPSPRGAAETLVDPTVPKPPGQSSKTEFDADPYGSFDGRDWNAPADISACADIAGCGTLLPDSNPSTYGAFTNMNVTSSDHITQASGGGNLVGTGCLPPSCSGTSTASVSTQGETDAAVQLTQFNRWDSLIDAAKSKATQTVTVDSPGLTGTHTFGTAAAPQITVINWNTSATNKWNAQVSGAGVLIIEVQPTSNVVLRGTGGLDWQGLVIVRGVEVEYEIGCDGCAGPGGTNRVFGQVVNRSSKYAEIEFENNRSFVKYSSAAMNMVRQQFQSFSSFKSWQEVAAP